MALRSPFTTTMTSPFSSRVEGRPKDQAIEQRESRISQRSAETFSRHQAAMSAGESRKPLRSYK